MKDGRMKSALAVALALMAPEALSPAQAQQPEFATEPEWAGDGRRLLFAGGQWPDLDL